MISAYNFNLSIKGTFSSSFECPLYTGLTVFVILKLNFIKSLFFFFHQAANSRPESAYAYNSDPFIHAAVTGDVLADEEEKLTNTQQQPQFSFWR
jgi:hypothetical protein